MNTETQQYANQLLRQLINIDYDIAVRLEEVTGKSAAIRMPFVRHEDEVHALERIREVRLRINFARMKLDHALQKLTYNDVETELRAIAKEFGLEEKTNG